MDFKKVMDQYKDFTYKFNDELQKDFDEQNDFKTNIRGLKCPWYLYYKGRSGESCKETSGDR